MHTSCLLLASLCLPIAVTGQGLQDLLTRAERSNYEETSTYDDVMGFLNAVAEASPLIQLTTFGTTVEGRAMPLAIAPIACSLTPKCRLRAR